MTSPADKIKERLDFWRGIEEKATPGLVEVQQHGGHPQSLASLNILRSWNHTPYLMVEDAIAVAFSRNNSATHRKAIEKLVELSSGLINSLESWEPWTKERSTAIAAIYRDKLAEIADMLSDGAR